MKLLLILKIGQRNVTNFSEVTKFFHDENFPRLFFSPIRYISGAHNSKSKCYFNAKPSAYYFYVKTKISVDFQIFISVLQLIYRNSGSSWILCLDYNFSRLLTQKRFMFTLNLRLVSMESW